MARRHQLARKWGIAVTLLMAVQAITAGFFVFDVIDDVFAAGETVTRLGMEIVANLALIGAIAFEGTYLAHLLRRQADADRALSVASGALHEVMDGYFAEWRLTPAEADVARFTIKGLSIAEIAAMRGSAEGTVKTHLNAIYRKAGVPGRTQLVNLVIEELLGGPILPVQKPAPRRGASGDPTPAA